MKRKSIKANAFFNTVKEVLDLVAPLITFPYVTRMLLPENLGKVQFATSIVVVFSYFAKMGISTYGVRKVAEVRDDVQARSRLFKNLLVLEIVLSVIVYSIFGLSLVYVDKFRKELVLFLILGLRIGFKIFGFEWFFKGMEEYKFMAIRKFIGKLVGIVLIFLFIDGPEDYILYATITIITLLISQIFNVFNLNKLVSNIKSEPLELKSHFSGIFYFFLIFISTKIYNDIDKIMLGFISNVTSVSYYVAATKLISIVLAIFTAASGVLVPRFSNLLAKGKEDKLKILAQKAFSIIFLLPLPAMAGLYLLSEETVLIFGGSLYQPAILTLRLLLPIMFFLPLNGYIGRQVLLTYGKHRLVSFALFMSVLFNIFMNSLLIPRFSQNGAAVASVLSEIFVIGLQIILGYKYIRKINLKLSQNVVYILATLFMSGCLYLLKSYVTYGLSPVPQVLLCSSAGAVLYFLFLLIARESLFVPMLLKIMRKKLPFLKRKKN